MTGCTGDLMQKEKKQGRYLFSRENVIVQQLLGFYFNPGTVIKVFHLVTVNMARFIDGGSCYKWLNNSFMPSLCAVPFT